MTHARRLLWLTAIVAILTVSSCGGDDDDTAASSTTTATSEASTSTSSTVSTSTVPTTGVPALPAPDHVTARSAGGSGEVEVEWSAVTGASSYRVLRANTTAGPFETVAEVDIQTGEVTAVTDVVNIWSDTHSYRPDDGALTAPDSSGSFRLVDVGPGSRCFRVLARDEHLGEASVTACASPP